jgi:hypothetical protein
LNSSRACWSSGFASTFFAAAAASAASVFTSSDGWTVCHAWVLAQTKLPGLGPACQAPFQLPAKACAWLSSIAATRALVAVRSSRRASTSIHSASSSSRLGEAFAACAGSVRAAGWAAAGR